jgi:protein SCO1/2
MPRDFIGLLRKESGEDEIAAAIDRAKRSPLHRGRLLQYLPQQHPIYQDRSANEVIRIRGYLFESFMHNGLPESALPFVLEALETGRHAYLVAAAAMAIRGLPAPRPEVVPYLLAAVRNMKFMDDAISFESYKPRWPLTNPTTALVEIFRTLQWLGAAAVESVEHLRDLCVDVYLSEAVRAEIRKAISIIEDANRSGCCVWSSRRVRRASFRRRKRLTPDTASLGLEDHDGRTITFGEYFSDKPALVVFFYTRCDNPNKCSLTITRLGQLQKALTGAGLEGEVKIAAITYDPTYDQPYRLESYCRNRGMLLDDQNRVFRSETGTLSLLRYFDAGVSYIGSIVNQHATELFILDRDGNIATHFQQLQWHVPEVVDELRKQVQKRQHAKGVSVLTRMRDVMSPLLSLVITFFPKCPLCLAAYVSVLGITNIHILQFAYQLLPVLVVLLFINLLSLFLGAYRRNGLIPFYLSLSGTVCVVVFGLLLNAKMLAFTGTGLILAGSLLNSLDQYKFAWMQQRVARLWFGLMSNRSSVITDG